MFSKNSGLRCRVMKSLAFLLSFLLLVEACTLMVSVLIDLKEAYLFLENNQNTCLDAQDTRHQPLARPSGIESSSFGGRGNLAAKGLRKIPTRVAQFKSTYLTKFSAAMTLVETAFPRACSSISSLLSRYFLPKKT